MPNLHFAAEGCFLQRNFPSHPQLADLTNNFWSSFKTAYVEIALQKLLTSITCGRLKAASCMQLAQDCSRSFLS